MRSLNPFRKPHARRRDPAPSRWGYKLQRLLLTPGFVSFLRIGVPLGLIAVIVGTWFANPENRAALDARVAAAKQAVQNRPEFMVSELIISGTDPALLAEIQRVLPMDLPASSFALDLEEMRTTVAALNAVEDVTVKLGEGGLLNVHVTPRVPVALWRDGATLRLIDASGAFSGVIAARADRLDLPLIAGDGAQAHIAEALALFQAAGPIAPRVRGLVRMGARRWDMVLDRNQRIQLPSQNPRAALDRVVVLSAAHDLLDRDVAVVDMRNADRPTIRMTSEAANALRRVSDLEDN
jgi:cell division protein FtsQ